MRTGKLDGLPSYIWQLGARPIILGASSILIILGASPIVLGVINSLAYNRKMHWIWVVRDASLLDFILDYGITFDEDANRCPII